MLNVRAKFICTNFKPQRELLACSFQATQTEGRISRVIKPSKKLKTFKTLSFGKFEKRISSSIAEADMFTSKLSIALFRKTFLVEKVLICPPKMLKVANRLFFLCLVPL